MTAKQIRERKSNLGFQLDPDLEALITRERAITPWKTKSQIVRDRLRQSYIDHPLDRKAS